MFFFSLVLHLFIVKLHVLITKVMHDYGKKKLKNTEVYVCTHKKIKIAHNPILRNNHGYSFGKYI